ncbi:hypothetical protein [Paenibacillus dakarensis]|uniref:hypothetical protein n=1 Tax=Paenibacillus dakarensis TaxID=1527293 RepID=UPI0006D5B16D|nr:hypothetical protein [Paenibacillus dakarensis]
MMMNNQEHQTYDVQAWREHTVLNFAVSEYVQHAAWAQAKGLIAPSKVWIGTWDDVQAYSPNTLQENEQLQMEDSSFSDDFLICEREDQLILAGRSERAALYAVYQYAADRWGMHWIYLGEAEPSISSPKSNRESFELHSPVMERRGFVFENIYDLEYIKSMVDWLAKNKCNEIFFTFMLWDSIGEGLAEEIKRRGINVTLGGHSMKFFLEKAENDSADKLSDHPYTAKKQLNYEDLSWQDKLIDDIVLYCRSVPNLTRLSLWPEDIADRGGTGFLRHYISFTERLHDRLAAANFPLDVEHIAYNAGLTWHMLERDELDASKEIDTLFAYWGRDYRYPFDNKANQSDERARQSLLDWISTVHKNDRSLHVFEYYSDHFMLTPLFPMLPTRIAEDIIYYRELGVDGITNLVVPCRNMDHYPWKWNHGFNSYVFCRSLWGAPIEQILNDYFAYYSDQERPVVMALFKAIEEIVTELTYWNVELFPARAVDPEMAQATPEQAASIIALLRKIQSTVKSLIEPSSLDPQGGPYRSALHLMTHAGEIEQRWLKKLAE